MRAAHIAGEIGVDRRIAEIARRRREIDERRSDDLLHDLLHTAVSVAGEDAIARSGLGIGQHCVADPRRRVVRHAMTSPSSAWFPRKSSEPATRKALAMTPTMKSSLTASRVQPWN